MTATLSAPGGHRNIEVILPARSRPLNPQPHAPEPYPARKAAARGLGGRKHGRRVAARYALYAPHGLGCTWPGPGSG